MDKKFEIIGSDYITIKNPLTGQPIKLYRILALRDLHIRINSNEYTEKIPKNIIIPKYSIGGYIESIENLDDSDESWVGGTAMVFNGAVVSMDSYICDNAAVYGNVNVKKSYIGGHNRTSCQHLNIVKTLTLDDCIFLDKTTVAADGGITSTTATNSSLIEGSVQLNNVTVAGGSFIKNSTVNSSKLFGFSGIKRSKISGCELYERFTYVDATAINETKSSEIELGFINGGN